MWEKAQNNVLEYKFIKLNKDNFRKIEQLTSTLISIECEHVIYRNLEYSWAPNVGMKPKTHVFTGSRSHKQIIVCHREITFVIAGAGVGTNPSQSHTNTVSERQKWARRS